MTGIKQHKIGRFTLQPFRQLTDQGDPVAVKPKALAILSVLAEANGALVTKDELMAAVWPNITVKGEPPSDREQFETETGKFEKYFSAEPGKGS